MVRFVFQHRNYHACIHIRCVYTVYGVYGIHGVYGIYGPGQPSMCVTGNSTRLFLDVGEGVGVSMCTCRACVCTCMCVYVRHVRASVHDVSLHMSSPDHTIV